MIVGGALVVGVLGANRFNGSQAATYSTRRFKDLYFSLMHLFGVGWHEGGSLFFFACVVEVLNTIL